MIEKGAEPEPRFFSVIDLTLTEEELRSSVRKRYKSFLNWGEQNIDLRVVDSNNVKEEDVESFRLLHIDVASRETRPKETWDVQYKEIVQDEAFAVFGSKDGELITASLFNKNKKYCTYSVGASKRELFEKPISHIIMWTGMMTAKAAGCSYFETGEFYYPHLHDVTEKELNISNFKSGFGGFTNIILRMELVNK